jgi:hypothetical protein
MPVPSDGECRQCDHRASDTVLFDGVGSNGSSSAAFSAVSSTGIGKGGGIDITTGHYLLRWRSIGY